MISVFVKTYTADFELGYYQARAIRAFFKDVDQYVLCTEAADLDRLKDVVRDDRVSYWTVEEHFPDALEITDGYARQQWIKIRASDVLGRHIQVDADMVPCAPLELSRWADQHIWDYCSFSPGNLQADLFKDGMRACGFAYDRSFMTSTGWVIRPELSLALRERVPDLRARYIANEYLYSEYHMLGETGFTHPTVSKLYNWTEINPYRRAHALHQCLWNYERKKGAGITDIGRNLLNCFASGQPVYTLPRYNRRWQGQVPTERT